VSPAVTTAYTVTGTDSQGCENTAYKIIAVRNPPQLIISTPPSPCIDDPPFTLSVVSPTGGQYSGPGVTAGNTFNPAIAGVGTDTLFYSYTDGYGCNSDTTFTITTELLYRIEGRLVYHNDFSTIMDNSGIKLLQLPAGTSDTTVTDAGGAFSFLCLDNGSYKINPATHKSWGGVNSTDALLAAQYAVGIYSPILTNLRISAADVNQSGFVNSVDALWILQRFAGNVTYFPAGDWLHTPDTVSLLNASDTGNLLLSICYGDVNGSYIPPPGKKQQAVIPMINDTIIPVNQGEIITIPVMAATEMKAGAISLIIKNLPQNLRLLSVEPGLAGLHWNRVNAELRIGWYDIAGRDIKEDEVLFKLVFATSKSPAGDPPVITFGLDAESEIAGTDARRLDNAALRIPSLRYATESPGQGNGKLFLGQNHPNPFTGNTSIPYYLCCEGRVSLELHSALGARLAVIVDETSSAGWHEAGFDAQSLAPGIYFYTLRLNDGSNVYQLTRRMVVGE
jgi:hypothetical protein